MHSRNSIVLIELVRHEGAGGMATTILVETVSTDATVTEGGKTTA